MAGSIKYNRYGILMSSDGISNNPSSKITTFSKNKTETNIISNDNKNNIKVNLIEFDKFKVIDSQFQDKKNSETPIKSSTLVVHEDQGVQIVTHCDISNEKNMVGNKECVSMSRHYCDYLKSKNLKTQNDFAKLIVKSKECRSNFNSLRALMDGFTASPEFAASVASVKDYHGKLKAYRSRTNSLKDRALNITKTAGKIFSKKKSATENMYLPVNYQMLFGKKSIAALAKEEASQFLGKTIQLIEICDHMNTINGVIEPSKTRSVKSSEVKAAN